MNVGLDPNVQCFVHADSRTLGEKLTWLDGKKRISMHKFVCQCWNFVGFVGYLGRGILPNQVCIKHRVPHDSATTLMPIIIDAARVPECGGQRRDRHTRPIYPDQGFGECNELPQWDLRRIPSSKSFWLIPELIPRAMVHNLKYLNFDVSIIA